MKTLNLLAIFLSIAQLSAIVYFLLKHRSDNIPFFIFLIVVPAVCVLALLTGRKR